MPDVFFSEVMRDADLTVSAAHTGETDPETSLSSVKGKIFLPFEDDDDMTAGIITRILLLSEDKKIKDQNI